MKAGYFSTWMVITEDLVSKNYENTMAMAKGNLKQTPKNASSTKENIISQLDPI